MQQPTNLSPTHSKQPLFHLPCNYISQHTPSGVLQEKRINTSSRGSEEVFVCADTRQTRLWVGMTFQSVLSMRGSKPETWTDGKRSSAEAAPSAGLKHVCACGACVCVCASIKI